MKGWHGRILVVFIALAMITSGCAMALTGRAKVQKEAFTPKKRYALVSISAVRDFMGERSVGEMFKDASEIDGLNTQPVIDELVSDIRAKFAKTGYFTSLPMKQIVTSKAYRAVEEDEKVFKVAFTSNEMIVAKGYKYLSDPQKLAKLARDLNVDGVITVTMSFAIQSGKSGLNVMGLSFGKKEYASDATITALAYDRDGNVLWKDTTVKQADPDDKKAIVVFDTSDWTATNFRKMHPSAVRVGSYSIDVLLGRFADTLEGRGTSTFQRISTKESQEATRAKSG